MSLTEGTRKVRGHLYDVTSAADPYNPSLGTSLGKVSDLIMPRFERDIRVYSRQQTGSMPVNASIDGAGLILQFGLSEYSAAVINILAQRIRPSGKNQNYNGPTAGNYKLGRFLGSSELVKLLIADKDNPESHPKLYIPKAVILSVENLSLSFVERMMDPATFEVIGLYDSTIGGPWAFGDLPKEAEA